MVELVPEPWVCVTAGQTDIDVECDMAQGRAYAGRGVPQGVCAGEHRRPTAARQPQYPADCRRLHGGRETVQVSAASHLSVNIFVTIQRDVEMRINVNVVKYSMVI